MFMYKMFSWTLLKWQNLELVSLMSSNKIVTKKLCAYKAESLHDLLHHLI